MNETASENPTASRWLDPQVVSSIESLEFLATQVVEGAEIPEDFHFSKAVYRWNGGMMPRTPGEAPVRIYEFVGIREG